jgi:hypothetical protein
VVVVMDDLKTPFTVVEVNIARVNGTIGTCLIARNNESNFVNRWGVVPSKVG